MSPLLIRPATIQDSSSIAKIHCHASELVFKNYLNFDPYPHVQLLDRQRMWEGSLRAAQSRVHDRITLVAHDSDFGVVGFISAGKLRKSEENLARLSAIYIDPRFQMLGVGRSLFLAGMASLRKRAFKRLEVWVLRDNPACEFYEKMGARLSETQRIKLSDGNSFEECKYVWEPLPSFMSFGSSSRLH